MQNVFKIVFIVIASIIGAGFASGKEIYVFFYKYGIYGVCGILLTTILFSLVIYKVLIIVGRYKINNYKEFLSVLMGKTQNNVNIIINIFLVITFYIMVAGFGAYFYQEYEINKYIASILFAIVCYYTLIKNVESVIKINSIITPILICFIILIGVINFKFIFCGFQWNELTNTSGLNINLFTNNWFVSSILYVSYNSILLIPLLVTLKKYIKSKKQVFVTAVVSGMLIGILAIIIYFLLSRINININLLDMPAVYVISNIFSNFKNIYAIIILISIYTTAISIGFSVIQNITKNKNLYKKIAGVICITSVLGSGIGFSNLINILYPIFGMLGIIQIILICKK